MHLFFSAANYFAINRVVKAIELLLSVDARGYMQAPARALFALFRPVHCPAVCVAAARFYLYAVDSCALGEKKGFLFGVFVFNGDFNDPGVIFFI